MVLLGLRNVARSKARLALVAVLIGLPYFLLLAMEAIGSAVERYTAVLLANVNNTVQLRARGSMGHVNMVGNEAILPQNALGQVRGVEHVARVEPYLLAMTPTEGHNFGMIVGVVPGDTKRLESHGEAGNPRIVAGRDLAPEDAGKRVAVIGQALARWAGIRPESLAGARLTLDLKRTHPVIFALDRPPATLEIVGIYASGYVFGDMQLFMPLDAFREIYGVPEGVSWLYVQADSSTNLAPVERRLRELLGDRADIIGPTSAAEFQSTTTRTVLRLTRGGVWLAAALMLSVVFFLMILMVRERAREIGTLKALGASDGGLVLAALAEALALCAIGAIVGFALFGLAGRATSYGLFAIGIAPFLPAQYKDTLGATVALSGQIGWSVLGLAALVGLAVAVAGSGYAIREILRLSPVEAIRHE